MEEECDLWAFEILSQNVVLITIYRPLSGNFNLFLEILNNVLSSILTCDKY